jgi:NhaP-type Na+/H+ or K+/H+ antiporter
VYESLAIFALFVALYSTVAGKFERTRISGPMIFVAFGFLMGPFALGWLDLALDSADLRIAADVTLALILFIDASNTDLRVLKRFKHIPERMLIVGLPLSIGLGFLVGRVLFPGLGLYEVAILATVLAATDAALGKPVLTNENVPKKLREGLNIESGLNDGICVPILLLFLALAGGHEGDSTSLALNLLAKEIGIGLVCGLGVATAGAFLIRRGHTRGWLTPIWKQITVIGLALGSFALAQSLHGSGYIAAFTGGLLFGSLAGKATHKLVHTAEGIGETLALVTWVLFGAAVVGQTWDYFTWEVIVYAALSLTVVRMLPIFLALTGTGLKFRSKLFLGWFGPRGLASIVFLVIVIGHQLPGVHTLAATVVCTVVLSVALHGITANPLAQALGRWVAREEPDQI